MPVVHLGVRTRDFAFRARGLEPPAEEFRMEFDVSRRLALAAVTVLCLAPFAAFARAFKRLGAGRGGVWVTWPVPPISGSVSDRERRL